MQAERNVSLAMSSTGNRAMGQGGSGEGADDYDMMMNNEIDMSGQFSPPHEPEEPRGFTGGKVQEQVVADIDSPYAD